MTNPQLICIAALGGLLITVFFHSLARCSKWDSACPWCGTTNARGMCDECQTARNMVEKEFAEAARDEGQTKTESEVRPVQANHPCASKSESRFRAISAAEGTQRTV